jgi:hypothetical protein
VVMYAKNNAPGLYCQKQFYNGIPAITSACKIIQFINRYPYQMLLAIYEQ